MNFRDVRRLERRDTPEYDAALGPKYSVARGTFKIEGHLSLVHSNRSGFSNDAGDIPLICSQIIAELHIG